MSCNVIYVHRQNRIPVPLSSKLITPVAVEIEERNMERLIIHRFRPTSAQSELINITDLKRRRFPSFQNVHCKLLLV
jgi:hypothetical protein